MQGTARTAPIANVTNRAPRGKHFCPFNSGIDREARAGGGAAAYEEQLTSMWRADSGGAAA